MSESFCEGWCWLAGVWEGLGLLTGRAERRLGARPGGAEERVGPLHRRTYLACLYLGDPSPRRARVRGPRAGRAPPRDTRTVGERDASNLLPMGY